MHITINIDTIFPGIDDAEEDIEGLLKAARSAGAQAVTLSYSFFRHKFKKRLTGIPFLQKSLSVMNEYQPIASGMGYSLSLSKKKVRLANMAKIALDIGYQVISTCYCKKK